MASTLFSVFLETTGAVSKSLTTRADRSLIPARWSGEISEERLTAARAYLRMRFPAMADAPLLESRVCQYENSTDHNFILDRHPEAENVWIVGGGSGHGFKHGPVMGEMVADAVLGLKAPPAEMGLGRLLKSRFELSSISRATARHIEYCSCVERAGRGAKP